MNNSAIIDNNPSVLDTAFLLLDHSSNVSNVACLDGTQSIKSGISTLTDN